MHLSYSFSRYKGKKYKSYAIAESYREGKKVKNEPFGLSENLLISRQIKSG